MPSCGKTTFAEHLKRELSRLDKSSHIPILNTDKYLINVLRLMYHYDFSFLRDIEIKYPSERELYENDFTKDQDILIDPLIDSFCTIKADANKKGYIAKSLVTYANQFNLSIIDNISDDSELIFFTKNGYCPIFIESPDTIPPEIIGPLAKQVYIRNDDDYMRISTYLQEYIKGACKYHIVFKSEKECKEIATQIVSDNLFKK